MNKIWQSARIELVFQNPDSDKAIKRRYNDLVEVTTTDRIQAFATAIDSLTQFPLLHAIELEEYLYEQA